MIVCVLLFVKDANYARETVVLFFLRCRVVVHETDLFDLGELRKRGLRKKDKRANRVQVCRTVFCANVCAGVFSGCFVHFLYDFRFFFGKILRWKTFRCIEYVHLPIESDNYIFMLVFIWRRVYFKRIIVFKLVARI